MGQESCVTATVTDTTTTAVAGVRVDFVRSGIHPGTGFITTDKDGKATYCYTGTDRGEDSIVASIGNLTDTAKKTWASDMTVTVTAEDKTITLGDSLPPFTYTASGFNGTDTFTTPPICTTEANTAAAGSYDIACTGGQVPAGYVISYILGSLTINPARNVPPLVSATGPYTGVERAAIPITGTASDADNDQLSHKWTVTPVSGTDAGASCVVDTPAVLASSVRCTDDGVYELTLESSDGVNPPVTSTAELTVSNAAPTVKITSPADLSVVKVGTPVALTATVTDPGSNDTLTCTIDCGDGTSQTGTLSSGTCTGTHSYATSAVYDVTVTGRDDDEDSGTDVISLVVYDQDTKVTGGGFTKTEASRMSFGFVAKESGGVLSGQLQVRLIDKMRFHGSTVTALTVSGNKATWSGAGSLDRVDGYTYTVTVTDNRNGSGKKGTPDTISLTITSVDGTIVTSTSAPLAGGNLTVHKP